MKHLAAYLLLTLGGKAAPSGDDVKSVLSAVGVDADAERLERLIAELKDKNVEELSAQGNEKLASVPAAGAAAAAPAAAGGGEAAPAEEAKEEKKEEEESDEDMGFGLFD